MAKTVGKIKKVRYWVRHELLIAMSLYCRIPFGQRHSRNKLVNEVADKINRSPGSVSRKLGNIASLDPRHQARGVGGLPNSSKLDRKVWEEFQENWSAMAEDSESAFESLNIKTDPLGAFPNFEQSLGPSETNRIVKTRKLQSFFRHAVLSSYEHRCALTGLNIPGLLIASHIIPWSENEHRRADPTNGLCLNVLHDKAFDRHLITFDENYRLVVSSALKKRNILEFQSSNFSKLEGATLTLPHRFAPDLKALEEHRNAFLE